MLATCTCARGDGSPPPTLGRHPFHRPLDRSRPLCSRRYVQHVLNDWGRNNEGTFLHVLTCMALAVTSVELIAALLLHALPAHGRNLALQLGLPEADILGTLSVALGVSRGGSLGVVRVGAGAGSESVDQRGLLCLALRRCGHSLGEPAPLFRHVGKRLGRAMLRFAAGSGPRAPT